MERGRGGLTQGTVVRGGLLEGVQQQGGLALDEWVAWLQAVLAQNRH